MEAASLNRPSSGVIKTTFKRNKVRGTITMPKKIAETKAYLAMKRLITFVDLFGKPLGWQLNYKWTRNPRHWCALIIMAVTVSQGFYSQWKYVMNGEYKKTLHVLPVLGVAIVRLVEIRCFQKYVKEITALNHFNFKLCRETSGKLADKFEKLQLQNIKILKFIFSLGLVAVLAYVFHPMKSFIFNRELVSLLPIEIMFLDQSKLSDFIIGNVLMMIMGAYSSLIALYMGSQFVFGALNCSMIVHAIEADIVELDELWRNTATTSVLERNLFVRNICRKCQDKENYISELKKVYDNTVSWFFFLAYISQIVCLYMINAENWVPGYGMAAGLFLEMMFYCFIGTKITIVNERLCYVITQSKWYTYDVQTQNVILMLLQSCMNSNELWIGPFAPLSVFTGTEIVKSIFSYYTILVEVM